MKELKIAEILAQRRKEKGVTQEEVAEYTGVSKASVSKWEHGQSYPDITILPKLAIYFNISIDELMGFQPQLSDKAIRKKYREFCAGFAERPFLDVVNDVRTFIRKYDSCYPLLLSVAQLYLNNYGLAASLEEGKMLLEEGRGLCRRIQRECKDTLVKKDAISMEAFISALNHEPDRIFELLGRTVRPQTPSEYFIIIAYQMLGEQEKAMEYLQAIIYEDIVEMLDYLSMYITLCPEERKGGAFERCLEFGAVFDGESLVPHKISGIYLGQAFHGAQKKAEKETLEALEKYVKILVEGKFLIHGDAFFDRLDEWVEESGLNAQMPRDIRLVRIDMAKAVTENPVFSFLKDDKNYRRLVKKLEALICEQRERGEIK